MSLIGTAIRPVYTSRLRGAVDCILNAQTSKGAIPWFETGAWDAWNHAECVMALSVAGEDAAATKGLDYLAQTQHPSGGWLCGYGNALPMDGPVKVARSDGPQCLDTNFSAYCATALWHRYWLTGERATLVRYWPMVQSAVGFVLSCQSRWGEMAWCQEAVGTSVDDAVLAGNASIFKSLGHALLIAERLGESQDDWGLARERLRQAILTHPERFDRAGQNRSGFAMDWYYPVLAGVLPAAAAEARLEARWAEFFEPGRGCRCVVSAPWVTVAESAELALALVGLGMKAQAAALLAWQDRYRDTDGAYWMGWQFDEDVAWPMEKPTWTQAAVILADDALTGRTPASHVLSGR